MHRCSAQTEPRRPVSRPKQSSVCNRFQLGSSREPGNLPSDFQDCFRTTQREQSHGDLFRDQNVPHIELCVLLLSPFFFPIILSLFSCVFFFLFLLYFSSLLFVLLLLLLLSLFLLSYSYFFVLFSFLLLLSLFFFFAVSS